MGKFEAFVGPFGKVVSVIRNILSMGPAFIPYEKSAELQFIDQSFRDLSKTERLAIHNTTWVEEH